ncbi:Protein FAR1-RELATED SEQUENCE 5 [Dendrobium catenatum]|uniref:Protein FAR1-RELATED SEQUENCE 5 n=1 Tax=Dendrobium catenatum TaxID=906689 RepID=A0A2I0VXA1_9ASPA|nr:Protein FAR1-RELATED SEQUENCE 5 [Dendrobium catenatum]
MIRFLVDLDGVWMVQKCIESHNHELARCEDQHLLRTYRNISDEKLYVLKSMTEAGIRTVDAFTYLTDDVRCTENIGFSKRDAYNYIQKEKRAKIENGNINFLIELFKD